MPVVISAAVPVRDGAPAFFPAAQATRPRTLIVEDDAEAAEVLQKALALIGHDVRCASTVFHGLRQLDQFKPTHLLLDLRFPDGYGTEILQRIRSARMPVQVGLITAASLADGVWLEALGYAPDRTFRKPWNLNQILGWLTQPPRTGA